MAILSEYVPCGWGVFWRDGDTECSTLTVSEAAALEFAARSVPTLAVIEQVFRRRDGLPRSP